VSSTELGQALRRWRDRIAPDTVGLPRGRNRRVPGLRREELAMLAGISVDYIVRLEQGRASAPSEQVVAALARALRLSDAERGHLFVLAGLQPPGPERIPTHLTPSVQRLLDRLRGTPVAVFDAMWTLLTANPSYSALMGDPSGWHGHHRNAVWRNFHGSPGRVRHTPESLRALQTALVGDLRSAGGRYPADPRLQRLIADLYASSPLFAELWDTGVAGVHETSRKTVDHPLVGAVTLDCDVLSVAGSDLRIMVYTAEPGSTDAERLDLLSVVGLQDLSGARPG
jgi:transcriptional regulator with XRE-family HTH domain